MKWEKRKIKILLELQLRMTISWERILRRVKWIIRMILKHAYAMKTHSNSKENNNKIKYCDFRKIQIAAMNVNKENPQNA